MSLTIEWRIRCDVEELSEFLALLEATHRGTPVGRHVVKGVPAKELDVYVGGREGSPLVVEIGWKLGKYDGAKRRRIQIQDRISALQWDSVSAGHFEVLTSPSRLVVIATSDDGLSLTEAFRRIPVTTLENYDLKSVIFHHYRRWFGFLEWRDVNALAEAFPTMHPELPGMDLNAANRAASRDLYALARSLGWYKMREYQQRATGLSSVWGQWVRQEAYLAAAAQVKDWHANGCGEHTIRISSGRSVRTLGLVEEDEE